MIEINNDYETEIRSIINQFGQHWRNAFRPKNKSYLTKYIFDRTSFLNNIKTDFKTRVMACLRHMTEVPHCKNINCNKQLQTYLIDNVTSEHPRETMFCSHECIYEARKKSNSYIHFEESYPTRNDKIIFLKNLVETHRLSFQRILQGKDYYEVAKWIYNAVPQLKNECYNVSTRLYWIINGLNDFPRCSCESCENKIGIGKNIKYFEGYQLYCSRQCSANSELTKQHLKESYMKHFGVDNPSKSKDILNKISETTLKHYGVKCLFTTKECREAGKKALKDKAKETSKKRLEAKENKQIYIKSNLIGSSMQEDQIRIWLENAFGENNVLTHYMSDEYPYLCDFFIKNKNLYIEYLGLWTHGKHPFNENNCQDIELLEKMKNKNSKYYDNAIYVWTDLDPRKRKIANDNKLNFLELWTMNEAADWISKNSQEKVPFVSLLKYKFKKCIFNPLLLSQNN